MQRASAQRTKLQAFSACTDSRIAKMRAPFVPATADKVRSACARAPRSVDPSRARGCASSSAARLHRHQTHSVGAAARVPLR
eukprot:6177817-Pleurochrysis_carterae.AAC.3